MKKHWRTATMGILAASLLFSQGAFAQGNSNKVNENKATVTSETTVEADAETEVEAEEEAEVNVDKFMQKLDRITAKFEQFSAQEVPAEAMQGKLGSIQNRVDALKAQLDELALLQEEVKTLDGEEAEAAVDSLATVYEELGKLEEALKVQQDYAKKLHDSTDEQILQQYKEIGKLLKKMGKTGVKALVNGKQPNMDVEPRIENGRTLVPFRALAEELGAEVEWNAELRTVTVTKDGVTVVLTIDQLTATIDGREYQLDVPAKIEKGRTLIPLRFLSEALKCKVLWEQETQTAVVIENQEAAATTETQTETETEVETNQ